MKSARLASVILAIAVSAFGQSSPAHQVGQSPSAAMFSSSLPETLLNAIAAPRTIPGELGSLLMSGLSFTGPSYFDAGGLGTYSVAVADLDGDGKLDLVALSGCLTYDTCAPAGVAVLLGNGDGTFQG